MARIIENPKQLILSTATNILSNRGYKELSIRNVAKECNIAVGTIYNYFPTKRDLIVEMMSNHWNEYFNSLESLAISDKPFFDKLENMFMQLETVIKNFREVWLKPELYQEPDYVEQGVAREGVYMEKLIRKIEEFLVSECEKPHSEIKLKLDSYETAKFILLNFITVIQMPIFRYQSFEKFLKELLQ